jgi:hypothetical protein
MRVLGIFALAAILLLGMGAGVGFAGEKEFDDDRFFFAGDFDKGFEEGFGGFFRGFDRFDDFDRFRRFEDFGKDKEDHDKDAGFDDPMFDFHR